MPSRAALPAPITQVAPQNLCADAGYIGEKARAQIAVRSYVPHVRSRSEEIDEKAKDRDYTITFMDITESNERS